MGHSVVTIRSRATTADVPPREPPFHAEAARSRARSRPVDGRSRNARPRCVWPNTDPMRRIAARPHRGGLQLSGVPELACGLPQPARLQSPLACGRRRLPRTAGVPAPGLASGQRSASPRRWSMRSESRDHRFERHQADHGLASFWLFSLATSRFRADGLCAQARDRYENRACSSFASPEPYAHSASLLTLAARAADEAFVTFQRWMRPPHSWPRCVLLIPERSRTDARRELGSKGAKIHAAEAPPCHPAS